jgi:hypothetical protein
MNKTFICLNIQTNSTTLGRLINIENTNKPEIVFLHEVAVNTETVEGQVTNYGYRAMCSLQASLNQIVELCSRSRVHRS